MPRVEMGRVSECKFSMSKAPVLRFVFVQNLNILQLKEELMT
jgi:hypothetical protein